MSAKADKNRNRLSINPDDLPPASQQRAEVERTEPKKATSTTVARMKHTEAPGLATSANFAAPGSSTKTRPGSPFNHGKLGYSDYISN